MIIVREKISCPAGLPRIAIRVSREQLSKGRWRATADDGTEFGFDLVVPLKHGDCAYCTDRAAYILEQRPEKVLALPLPPTAAEAAGLAWQLGNLHCPIEITADSIFVADNPAVRKWLATGHLSYAETERIFSPQRPHVHEHTHH
ncbi:MAG: hypothetical protein NZ740_09660 [Kiritimatiellae bacterium]|nr:hypothetical protein [Kiritimatiellia bacterium]MDW8459359.1 hypothetical protein [Verrucomicrobiota bacterium]